MRLRLALAPAVALLLTTGCVIIPLIPFGRQELREVTLMEADRFLTRSRFLVLDIQGTITGEKRDGFFEEGASLIEDVHGALEKAREDDNIEAVIVRIDSPGGAVTASDIIHREIMRYREETDVPVVAMLMQLATSGGYYVASAADEIVAHPTTVTGSIGVIVLSLNVEGLEDLVGVEVGAFTSGPHKDILSPFRSMTDEEREIIQAIVDEMYGRFIDVVAAGRAEGGLSREQIAELADGRICTAEQAREQGLVDEIAYLPDLVESLKEELDLDDVRVITYRRGIGDDLGIYSRGPAFPSVDIDLIDAGAFTEGLGPGFYYLWVPGL
jgi:protease-4